jgi:hypothetical protein
LKWSFFCFITLAVSNFQYRFPLYVWLSNTNDLPLLSIMQYEEEKKSPGAEELEDVSPSSTMEKKERKEKKKKKKHKSAERKDGESPLFSKSSKRKSSKASDVAVVTAEVELAEPGSIGVYPQQSAKTKRTVAVAAPGAVSVRAQEPESFNTSHGTMNEDVRVPDTKKKRTVAATSPGAVAVKSQEPESWNTSRDSGSVSSRRSGKTKRTVAAASPGAVAVVAEEPDAFKTSRGSIREELEELDGASRQSGKTKRTVAATTPGVVAMAAEEPDSFNTSRGSIREELQASSRQSGKTKRTVAASTPGVVAMAADEPDSFNTSRGSIRQKLQASFRQSGKTKRTMAALSPGVVAVATAEPDSFSTSRGSIEGAPLSSLQGSSKTKGTVAASVPHAVAAQGEEPESFHSSRGSIRQNHASTLDKSGSDSVNRMNHEAKSRGMSGRGAVTTPGAESLSEEEALAADEAMRHKDPRSSARSKARALQAATVTAAAVGVTTAAMVGTQPEETNEAYRRRLDAKIDAMENDAQSNRDVADKITLVSDPAEPNPADEKGDSFADLAKTRELFTDPGKSEPFFDPETGGAFSDPDKGEPFSESRSFGGALADDDDKNFEAHLDRGDLADDEDKYPPVDEMTSEAAHAQGISRPPDLEYGEVPGTTEGLAVAVAVEEEEDNPLLSAAIEYDPDSKPPLVYNRRFRLYAIVGAFLLMAIVAGVVVGVVTKDSSGPQEPTPAPTTLLEKSYRDQFVVEVGDEVNVPGSPQARAAEWIMYEDPLALSPDAPNLIQRYHLALLYYRTTKNGELRWNSCNPPMASETDFCTFQDIGFTGDEIEYTVYTNIPDQVRWMAGLHECEWRGTFCDPNQNVIALQIGK